MLLCPASSAAHQSDAVAFNVEYGCRRVSPITTGLREQCAARILGETSAVGAQCFGSSDLRTQRFDHVSEALMVLNWLCIPRVYSIQNGGPGPPSSTRQRLRIPEPSTRLSDVLSSPSSASLILRCFLSRDPYNISASRKDDSRRHSQTWRSYKEQQTCRCHTSTGTS